MKKLDELRPETYGLQYDDLAAAMVLQQYVIDHGPAELEQAIQGDTVDAAMLAQQIDKAREHGVSLMRESGMSAIGKERFMCVMEHVKGSNVMTEINPQFLNFLTDLLQAAHG